MASASEMNDLSFSVVSIVEDVLQQHSSRSSDVGLLVPRRVEESCEFLTDLIAFSLDPSSFDFFVIRSWRIGSIWLNSLIHNNF